MSDRIELTDDEQIAAVGALRKTVNAYITSDDYGLLATAIAAINKVRAGDPVGTIRRHVDGNVAVNTEAGWVWVARDGDTADSAPLNPTLWPVIYRPEES